MENNPQGKEKYTRV